MKKMAASWASLLQVMLYHWEGFLGTNGTRVVWLYHDRTGQAAEDVLVLMHYFLQFGIKAEESLIVSTHLC